MNGKGRPWIVSGKCETVPLMEIASIENGKVITELQALEGSIPVVAGGRVPAYMHNQSNSEGQCFTISRSGAYSGYVWWHEESIWASDCIVVRSLDEHEYMTFYLFLCMKAKQEEIYSRQQGTGQPHVYKKHIQDFPILKLTPSEQWNMVNEVQELHRQRVDANVQQENEMDKSVAGIDAIYKGESNQVKERRIYKADYGEATPTDVAKALLTYRPRRTK